MLDLKIALTDSLAQSLLSRLDRLIEILEYKFPTPRHSTPDRPAEPLKTGGTFISISGEERWYSETATARLWGRLGREPTEQEVTKEVQEQKTYGL